MPGKITIAVVYNNFSPDKDRNLEPAWGFSCLVEGAAKTILFDAGGDGAILLANMEKMGIDPGQVEAVFLSHIHGDHTGGLGRFLDMNSKVEIFAPQSFPERFLENMRSVTGKVVPVDEPVRLCRGVWTTGEMGTRLKEQSMVIETGQGLVVITGCAHPGIVEIVLKAKAILNQPVYLVMGGFHLFGYGAGDTKKVIDRLKNLGVQKVGPSHCTGDEQIGIFQKAWGKDFINLGLGGGGSGSNKEVNQTTAFPPSRSCIPSAMGVCRL
jgi:7,8-dihydropterin-6-yl-methyl-4-(beta-D-ribofuranosyl)aminobenzene 5'-phosphate synthase